MTWEASRIPVFPLRKRVVREAHELPGEVGPQIAVEASVDDLPGRVTAERIGLGPWVVGPSASDSVALFEDDDAVALSLQLPGRAEPEWACSDHCHSHGPAHWLVLAV